MEGGQLDIFVEGSVNEETYSESDQILRLFIENRVSSVCGGEVEAERELFLAIWNYVCRLEVSCITEFTPAFTTEGFVASICSYYAQTQDVEVSIGFAEAACMGVRRSPSRF